MAHEELDADRHAHPFEEITAQRRQHAIAEDERLPGLGENIELPQPLLQRVLDALALADVACDERGADHAAELVAHRRKAQRQQQAPSATVEPLGLERSDALAKVQAPQHVALLVAPLRRHEAIEGAAKHFLDGVAEQLDRPGIPRRDASIPVAAHDRVARRGNDCREARDVPEHRLALGDVDDCDTHARLGLADHPHRQGQPAVGHPADVRPDLERSRRALAQDRIEALEESRPVLERDVFEQWMINRTRLADPQQGARPAVDVRDRAVETHRDEPQRCVVEQVAIAIARDFELVLRDPQLLVLQLQVVVIDREINGLRRDTSARHSSELPTRATAYARRLSEHAHALTLARTTTPAVF